MNSDNVKRVDGEMKMRAVIILDIIGKPAEHLTQSLEMIVGEIDKEKGITIIKKEIKEPIPFKENKEFFTTFADIEVEIDDFLFLLVLLFKYMPAHIEIVHPEFISLSNNGWNDVLNELSRRLHGYDEIARVMQAEKNILIKKVEELAGKPIGEIFKKVETKQEAKKIPIKEELVEETKSPEENKKKEDKKGKGKK